MIQKKQKNVGQRARMLTSVPRLLRRELWPPVRATNFQSVSRSSPPGQGSSRHASRKPVSSVLSRARNLPRMQLVQSCSTGPSHDPCSSSIERLSLAACRLMATMWATAHSPVATRCVALQGYLARKKTPKPLGPPQHPRHRATVGSQGGALSYERGTPVNPEP